MTVLAPENLGHLGGCGVELGLVLVPDVARGVEAVHAADALQHVGAERSSLGRGDTALVAEGGTGCKQGCLRLDGLGDGGRHQVTSLRTKHEVEAGVLSTQGTVFGRNLIVVADVAIRGGKKCHGTVTVGEDLLHAVGKCSAWLIEVRTTVFRSEQQGHTIELAVVSIAAVSHQQIVVEQSAQSEGLALEAVDEHLLFGSGTGGPLHPLHLGEEEVDVLDAVLTFVPLRHGVVVGGPGTGCHVQIGAARHIGDGIVGSNICLGGRDVWQTVVAIDEQAVRILRLLVHGILSTVVLIRRIEHVVAGRTEGTEKTEGTEAAQ